MKTFLEISVRPPSETCPRLIAKIDCKALEKNYALISEKFPGQMILPMIKANAYGHGEEEVARILAKQKKIFGLGVATFEEASHVSRALGTTHKTPVVIFSGTAPWNDQKAALCRRHGWIPVLSTLADWELFYSKKHFRSIPRYHLKFNTGMNRLGLPMEVATQIFTVLNKLRSTHRPEGILTHLADADRPKHPTSQRQMEALRELHHLAHALSANIRFHFANSAALWNARDWQVRELSQVVRPGLSLYGVRPWLEAPQDGFEPVMSFQAQVVCDRTLNRGDALGYGSTYVHPHDQPKNISILSAGYADGLLRILSNRGKVWLDGQERKIAGNISMDLCAVESGTGTPGRWAEVFGKKVDIWQQAIQAKTIPYELMTALSMRVKREYLLDDYDKRPISRRRHPSRAPSQDVPRRKRSRSR